MTDKPSQGQSVNFLRCLFSQIPQPPPVLQTVEMSGIAKRAQRSPCMHQILALLYVVCQNHFRFDGADVTEELLGQ